MSGRKQALENLLKQIMEVFKSTQGNLKENQFKCCIIKVTEKQSKISKQPTLINPYPITLQKLPNGNYPQGYARTEWTSMKMLDLRRFKDVIVSYGICSAFVKQMLNSWLICNKIISQDQLQQSWSPVLNYNGEPGRKMKLRPLNNKVE